jgi:hypothetical protein
LTALHARPGHHATAIVGRHDACDLFLPASDELPLRQLAARVHPIDGEVELMLGFETRTRWRWAS